MRFGIWEMSVEAFIDAHNADPKPLVWTAEVKDILPKIARAHAALDTVVN